MRSGEVDGVTKKWQAYVSLSVGVTVFAAMALTLVAFSLPVRADSPPICLDSFPTKPTEVSAYSAVPVHNALFRYLLVRYAQDAAQSEYECRSDHFRYRAEIRGGSVVVESRYRSSGRLHTIVSYPRDEAERGFRRHGVTEAYWPNGRLQAREYFCHGNPVGFQRYFDQNGRLTSIADFTKSDYRIERNPPGKHTLLTENGGILHPSAPVHFGFMEGYDLSRPKARRIRFMSAYFPSSEDWKDLDLNSTVATWANEGHQSTVALGSSAPLRLINEAMDYTPFWEHFQRDRLGLPGRDPVDPETARLLRCPWLDDAMSLAKERPEFAFPKPASVSDFERSSTPRAKYLACMENPSPLCLLQNGLGQAKLEDSHRDVFLRGAAEVAMVIHEPNLAIEAMDAILQKREGFGTLDPHFALFAAIKAQAASQAGQQGLADELAQRAFDHATAPRPAHEQKLTAEALQAIAVPLVRAGNIDLARRAYELIQASYPAKADEILMEIGLAELRGGHADNARSIANDLRSRISNPWKYQPAPPSFNRPWGYFSAEEAQILALANSVRGAAEGSHAEQASALAKRIEIALHEQTSSLKKSSRIPWALAAMYARLGLPDKALNYLASVDYRKQEAITETAALLCDAGRIGDGQALLDSLLVPGFGEASAGSTKVIANLAKGRAKCGQPEEAVRNFELARSHANKTPFCSSDMCWNFTAIAHRELAEALIDAGELDLVNTWGNLEFARPEYQIQWVQEQIKRGKFVAADAHLSRLKEVSIRPGQAELRSQVLLMEGELLASQDHILQATEKRIESVNATRSIGDLPRRATAFRRIARLMAARGDQAGAMQLLDEALYSYDEILVGRTSQPGANFDDAATGFTILAGDFARLGQSERSQEIVEAFRYQPGMFAYRRDAEARVNRLEIELLVEAMKQDRTTELQTELESYSPSLTKLLALDRVRQQALSGEESKSHASYWSKQVLLAKNYLDQATSDVERRQMIGIFASWLRAVKLGADAQAGLSKLVELSVRIDKPAWRSRALCELGYTAASMAADQGDSLFTEGLALAARHERRTFPLDPPPSGACAFWLKQAGNPVAAKNQLDQTMQSTREQTLRSQGMGRWVYAGDLLSFAIAAFESEQGEILVDWRTKFWE